MTFEFEFDIEDENQILENNPIHYDDWVIVNADDLEKLYDDSKICPKCKHSDLKSNTCNAQNLYSGSCEWTCKLCKHVIDSTFNSVPTQHDNRKQGTKIIQEEQIQEKTNAPWRMQHPIGKKEMTQFQHGKERPKEEILNNNCFCSCGYKLREEIVNNELKEEVINGETIFRCGICEKVFGDPNMTSTNSIRICQSSSDSFVSSSVDKQISKPRFQDGNNCFYPCGNSDQRCFSLLGDTNHHTALKKRSLNKQDSTSTLDLLSADSFDMQDNSSFCSCENPYDNQLMEEVINGETMFRCGICKKLFGYPNMTSKPPPLPPRKGTKNNQCSFVSSSVDKPPQVPPRSKGTHNSRLNTCSSSYNSKPRFQVGNNCFCSCGKNDPSKLREESVNNETFLKCCACFSLLGDKRHYTELKRCSLNKHDSTSTQDLLSVDTFGIDHISSFCSCENLYDNELTEEVINGETISRCGICKKIFGDPNSDLLEDVAIVECPPLQPRTGTNTNQYSVSYSVDKPPQVPPRSKGTHDLRLNACSSSYNSKPQFKDGSNYFSFLGDTNHHTKLKKRSLNKQDSTSTPDLLSVAKPPEVPPRLKGKTSKALRHVNIAESNIGRGFSQNDILSAKSTVSNWEDTTLYLLFPGDHVRWLESIILPKYQGIVTDIDRNANVITIVRNNPWREVEEIIINPIEKKIRFEKAIYTYQGYDLDTVVVRARSRLGEKQFNLLKNNEHQFATFCKAGIGGVVPQKSVPIQASKPNEYLQIYKFEQIQEGSHIRWLRNTYEHHAVIYKVYPLEKHVIIAHYSAVDWPQGKLAKLSTIFKSGDLAKISLDKMIWEDRYKRLVTFQSTHGSQKEDWAQTLPGPTFIAHYSGQVYPVEKIQELVKKRLGETAYNVVTNNCEHFAISCCTGYSRSLQVQELAKRYLISFTAESLVGVFQALEQIIDFLPEINSIISKVDTFLEGVKGLLPFNLIGPLIQCIIMVVIKGIRIYSICKSHTEKKDKRSRNIKIGAEICEGVAGIALTSVIGFVLGVIIPIPILGQILGAILGTVLGHVLGKFVKNYLLKKIDRS